MARPKKQAGGQDFKEVLGEIAKSLKHIEERLEQPKVAPTTQELVSGVKIEQGFPIPLEYTELVNTLLNKKFKVEIKYQPDAAAFEFAILVPKEYSNASPMHWETFKEDRRNKVIQNAYGANGVREYVLQVYDNFPTETKSMITYDRAQL